MNSIEKSPVDLLIEKGVEIPSPLSVEIGPEVDLDKISSNIVIHVGCKIFGKNTLIMGGVILGECAPTTINNCQLGCGVKLKGGYFENSTFLDSANSGSYAEIRSGCLLEEKASIAHCVGLKQTILFPFVTLGSLVNFCDILMAGGTSRENHSEVGSSYIHFNYTPNQDKATASLVGDVARGVTLDEDPIFLGGQGGLVGPARINYGTTIAAGVVYRKDNLEEHKLLLGDNNKSEKLNFFPGIYWSIKRRVINCIHYIANIISLKQWYIHVRSKFFKKTKMQQLLYEGAIEKLDLIIDERIKRLKDLANKMDNSIQLYKKLKGPNISRKLLERKKQLYENIGSIVDQLKKDTNYSGELNLRENFLKNFKNNFDEEKNYIENIKNLDDDIKKEATNWLLEIVNKIIENAMKYLPSFGGK